MLNIDKLKFHILNVSGNINLSWRLDVELQFEGEGLTETLNKNENANERDKENIIIFIVGHLQESFKVQYLINKDPLDIWNKLREMYDHSTTMAFFKFNMPCNI